MHLVHLTTPDFDQLAQHVHAWDAQLKQLSVGPFSGSLTSLQMGSIGCMQLETSQAVICRGTLKRPAIVLTPVKPANSRAHWRGHSLQPAEVNILGVQDVMDHVTSKDYASCSLIIDNQFLTRVAARQWDVDIHELLRNQVAFRPSLQAYQQMSQLPERFIQAAREGQHLEEAEITEETLDVLFQAVLSLEPRLHDKPEGSTRQRIVRKVNDYLASHPCQMVLVSELCRAAHCSERTLQYAIMERYGVTPKMYLQHYRLNGVRQELKQAEPHRSMVGTIARRWGFHHTGEFAASYQRLFGELPSETIRQYHQSCRTSAEQTSIKP